MLKRIYAAVLLLVFAQVSYAAWDGSVKIPKTVKTGGVEYYEITSPEELIGFLDSVTMANMGKESLRAYLKNDIVFGADTSKLCDKRWNRSYRLEFFSGDFDGRGHTIYGLNSERPLFEIVGQGSGSVHDFNVANSSFGSDTTSYDAAAVVGSMQSGLWNVNVINTNVRGMYSAGGIVGRLLSNQDDREAYILNCNMIGGSVKGSTYVGGIASSAYGRISGCSNSAKIYLLKNEGLKLEYTVYVGGIAGDANSHHGVALEDCVNRGDIEMVTLQAAYVGGISGFVLGAVSNLQNYGNVSSKVAFSAPEEWIVSLYVGGVIGSKHFRTNEYSETRDFVNEGDVTTVFETNVNESVLAVGGVFGEVKNNAFRNALNKGSVKVNGVGNYMKTYVGGIIGYTYIYADVRGFEKLGNRGNVSAEGPDRVWTGGVIGYMDRPLSQFPALFMAYNYGDVTGAVTDDPMEYGVLNVGGIFGYAYETIISDVYNRGKVIAKGKLNNGFSEVGGLVGYFNYPDFSVSNSYSAAPVIKGDSIGGLFGFSGAMVPPKNTYYDGSLVDVAMVGRYFYDAAISTECKKPTEELQSEKMVALLNTAGGTVANRNLWTRRPDGYPVLKFDSLYKNDSAYFDTRHYAMAPSRIENDTTVYTISKPEELATFLTMHPVFRSPERLPVKVELANDIVMGRDSTLLSARQMSADTSYAGCLKAGFDGKGHTIYGLNMSRAMFFCMDSSVIVQNFTVANSRFENDWGRSAAAVVINNGGTVKNVTVRNSLVRGGYSAGGIVANNHYAKYGIVLNSKNENTTVISSNISGGIAGESEGVLQSVRNSGRVYGRLAGGIVGKNAPYYIFNNSARLVSDAYNSGTVVATGEAPVAGGGIAGYSQLSVISGAFNTGLVEGSVNRGALMVGGIAGRIDSTTTLTGSGNWGRVHALNGEMVYAGGLAGRVDGNIMYDADGNGFVLLANVVFSFNYGPVTVKKASDESYAGGLIGIGKGVTMQTDYNRGAVRNEANVANAVTGGIGGLLDSVIIAQSYSYGDTLIGKKVGAVLYEPTGFFKFNHVMYASNIEDAYRVSSAAGTDSIVEPLSFEEMMFSSVMQLYPGFKHEKYIDNGCLPVFAYDTTSSCAVTVVKDSIGDANEPYKVGYIVDVFYTDSTSNPGGGLTPVVPEVAKIALPKMQVEVSGRNVTVTGLVEKRPVMVFDMRGRMVTSARAHGTSVNLSIPKSGRYLVRSGKQSRMIVVR